METLEKFEKLKPEKKTKIINAGLEVFSNYGYEQASTDLITQKAQISKGALFHYFENKENFFIYLFNYASVEIANKVNPAPPIEKMDIFEYLPYITKQKIDLIKEYPFLMNFVMKAYEQNYHLLKEKGKIDFFENYQNHSNYILQEINFDTLNKGISKETFLSWVSMISQGFIQNYVQFPEEHRKRLIKELFFLFDELKKNFRKD
ncbi:MAG: TetR/AcrR family transcriptional regulator [Bacilli bacterium]|jgi:AcrR family transcriptional regulator|nr:TetR/AcrR family transcriptional regulator [Acholeplasmataceae bacterium]